MSYVNTIFRVSGQLQAAVTGLDHMMCMQQFWSIPHEKVMKSIRLFGKHVIPHFVRENGAAQAEASH
jgi:hypothetical protein